MRSLRILVAVGLPLLTVGLSLASLTVPTDVQQPGTQPQEVSGLETPDKCDNCHGGYSTAVEPTHQWRGSMMAQATRDPIFWATLAVAEQDFDGVGDLCLRCHSPEGWLAGHSTPTDGSGLQSTEANGVSCDLCHRLADPDGLDPTITGVQNPPFLANDEAAPATGYYGSGMYVVYDGSAKLGPYSDAEARHQFLQSSFHRSSELCGTCHDVSNPAVGDLAHNNGAQTPLAPGSFSGVPGAPVEGKAAFNNFPFQYGIVERTYSEHRASLLSTTLVSSYTSLPADLRAGAIEEAYQAALVAGTGGNYSDGTPRYFSCQSCHMRPVTGQGCNKNPPVRKDLPLHDLTGGNYWMPDVIRYLDNLGKLRIGGGLTASELAALDDGKLRAQSNLREAASLSVNGNTLTVTNLTGHKLLSGYPEGRRMWLNVRWYDADGALVREDGRYGALNVTLDGSPTQVQTILDLGDPNTKIYEAHLGMTREWAAKLVSLGWPPTLPLGFDRVTGATTYSLGQLAAQAAGTHAESFHFALNNLVVKDNRIPPYGMSRAEATQRNILPVPASQYGNPGPTGHYDYHDLVTLNPPAGAVYATIDLLYQPTSWEYVQFLYLANTRQNAFLANEGVNLLDAWRNTGMAAPYGMASATWGIAPPPGSPSPTATRSPTATATGTATATPTAAPSLTASRTSTLTATASPSSTATRTATATAAWTPTGTSSATSTGTSTPAATSTLSRTATRTATATATDTLSLTPTRTPTVTATDTPSPTATRTAMATAAPSATATPSLTATGTPTATASVSASSTPTTTTTATFTPPILTATATFTPTATASTTPSSTATESSTPVPGLTASPTASSLATVTASATAIGTAAVSGTPHATATPVRSPTMTATETPVPGGSPSPTARPTSTPVPPRLIEPVLAGQTSIAFMDGLPEGSRIEIHLELPGQKTSVLGAGFSGPQGDGLIGLVRPLAAGEHLRAVNVSTGAAGPIAVVAQAPTPTPSPAVTRVDASPASGAALGILLLAAMLLTPLRRKRIP